MCAVEFYWNTDSEPLKLGSLLMFRKAVENYLEFERSGQAHLNFIQKKLHSDFCRKLVKLVFKDTDYKLHFSTKYHKEQLNPLKGCFNYYSTWYGLENQIAEDRGTQSLSWKRERNLNFNDYVTCHLRVKREDEETEVYHARTNDWCKFFEASKGQKFMLLGDDHYPAEIVSMENVEVAKDYDLDLNEQLMLIDETKAFCGSASGISAAAVLSSRPFLIFKHPDHHPWEYITPSFLKPSQRQVRQIDRFENIMKGPFFERP